MDNKITAVLSPESMQKLNDAISVFYAELPYLLELSPTESRRLLRMESGRSEFVRSALVMANTNERLRPQFFELAEFEKDLSLCENFDALIAPLEKLLKLLNDTRNQAGHEAYLAALEVYSTVKRAAAKGIPGAQTAHEELKRMFSNNGRKTLPNTPVTP